MHVYDTVVTTVASLNRANIEQFLKSPFCSSRIYELKELTGQRIGEKGQEIHILVKNPRKIGPLQARTQLNRVFIRDCDSKRSVTRFTARTRRDLKYSSSAIKATSPQTVLSKDRKDHRIFLRVAELDGVDLYQHLSTPHSSA